MADFNEVLEPGDYENGTVNTVIEIPQGSMLKIEWDRKRAAFTLDRVEPAIFAKPINYGFIPQTLDEDGDELDTLVYAPEPIPTGVWLEARIIGVMKFEDGGEVDDKILVTPVDNRDQGDAVTSLADVPALVKKLEHHFNHYKDLKKPGTTRVLGWGDAEEAKQIIKKSIDRYNTQK